MVIGYFGPGSGIPVPDRSSSPFPNVSPEYKLFPFWPPKYKLPGILGFAPITLASDTESISESALGCISTSNAIRACEQNSEIFVPGSSVPANDQFK